MYERINEGFIGRMDIERRNEWMNESMKEGMNELKKEWMMNECIRINESMKVLMDE